jgi:protein-tyrosine kinase
MSADKAQESQLFHSMLRLLLRRKMILFSFVMMALAGALIHHVFFSSYTATASLHIKQNSNLNKVNAFGKQGLNLMGEAAFEKYLKILRSENYKDYITEEISKNPKLSAKLNAIFQSSHLTSANDYAVYLINHNEYRGHEDEIIDSIAEGGSELSTVFTANLMAQFAKRYILIYENREIEATANFLSSELEKGQQRIEGLNKEIENIKSHEDVLNVTVGDSVPSNVKSIYALQSELELLQVKMSENTFFANQLVRDLKKTNGVDLNIESSEVYNLRGRNIDRLKGIKETEREYQARVKALESRLDKLRSSLQPQHEQKIMDIRTRLGLEHDIFLSLKKQLFDTELNRVTLANVIRDYSTANKMTTKEKLPLPKKLALTGLLAFTFICLIVYMIEQLVPTVSSAQQLRNLGLESLGSVPSLDSGKSLWVAFQKEQKSHRSGLIDFNFNSKESIAFQIIRLPLLRRLKNTQKPQIISVVSPVSGEGKSFVAANLAKCFHQGRKKTLLIDCDPQSQAQARYFGNVKSLGFTEYVTEKANLKDVRFFSSEKHLDFIPAGEAFADYMDALVNNLPGILKTLKESFDVIILDTPAFFKSNQALTLCQNSDSVIVATEAHKTKIEDLNVLIEALRLNQVESIYTVVNRLDDVFKNGPGINSPVNTDIGQKPHLTIEREA